MQLYTVAINTKNTLQYLATDDTQRIETAPDCGVTTDTLKVSARKLFVMHDSYQVELVNILPDIDPQGICILSTGPVPSSTLTEHV